MKYLLVILAGICPFFNFFAMERDDEAQGSIRNPLLMQMEEAFKANQNLPLCRDLCRYHELSHKLGNTVQINFELQKVLEEIKQYVTQGKGTIDMLLYLLDKSYYPLSRCFIEYGALDRKLGANDYSPTTSDEKSAVLNMQNKWSEETLLHQINVLGINVMHTILLNNADPNIVDKFKTSPLMRSAGRYDLWGVMLLLAFNADVMSKDFQGRTALHYIAQLTAHHHKELGSKKVYLFSRAIAEHLIDCGADISVKDIEFEEEAGHTYARPHKMPLDYALDSEQLGVAVALFQAGVLNHLNDEEKASVFDKIGRQLNYSESRMDKLFGKLIMQSENEMLNFYEKWLEPEQIDRMLEDLDHTIKTYKYLLGYNVPPDEPKKRESDEFQEFMINFYRECIQQNPTFCTNIKRIRKFKDAKACDAKACGVSDPEAEVRNVRVPNIFYVLRADALGSRGIKRGHKRLMNEKVDYIDNDSKPSFRPYKWGEDDGIDQCNRWTGEGPLRKKRRIEEKK